MDADVIVVGAGLTGLVASTELAAAGRRVLLLDQEPPAGLGGQAHWALGGLFLVDTPEQRAAGIHDSLDLAWQDWLCAAGFDRPDDHWPHAWARAYVEFAAGEKRAWLAGLGHRLHPAVRWARRGGGEGSRGNSVPRFHVGVGGGAGLVELFARRVRDAADRGPVRFAFRHRVRHLTRTGTTVSGVEGDVLAPCDTPRGQASPRTPVSRFSFTAGAVLVACGGLGGDLERVRRRWPARLGTAPADLLCGVPAHVDGDLLEACAAAGGQLVNTDRMWHYSEGVRSWAPVWPRHGVRLLPGPSALWFDGAGRRLPVPLFPGADPLAALEYVQRSGFEHTWLVLTRRILDDEFTLSGPEYGAAAAPLEAFLAAGIDAVVATDLDVLVASMNRLTPHAPLDAATLRHQIETRDRATAGDGGDPQVHAIRADQRGGLVRTAPLHRILDPAHGPLIAVRLRILTRKSLGGLATDLDARVLADDGTPVPGLYAAGEAAGFGGGGMHGYRALEGSFLGGCLFSGRRAGRVLAAATAG